MRAPDPRRKVRDMNLVLSFLGFCAASFGSEPLASLQPSGQVIFLYRLSQPDGSQVTSSTPDGVGLQAAYFGARGKAGSDFFDLNTNLGIERTTGTLSSYTVSIDEAFVDMGPIHRFTLRVGKFRQRFGIVNAKRVNEVPYLDRPLIYQEAFGPALNEVAVSFLYRMSFLPWVSEFSEQFYTPTNATLFGGTSNATNIGGTFYWRNEFPLTGVSQLILDLGSVYGTNTYGAGSHVYEAGLTFKTERFKWANDYLYIYRKGAPANEREGGFVTSLEWEFTPRWWAQGRFDFVGLPSPDAGPRRRLTALFAHAPNANAAVRFQYDYSIEPTGIYHRGQIQLIVGIGAATAHGYGG